MRRLHKDTAGVAALEFALIFPVLLVMTAGLTEYGRVLFVQQAVRNIIDETARRAVVTSLTSEDVENAVQSALEEVSGIQEFEVDVDDGAALSVAVTGSFALFFGELLPQTMIEFEVTTQFPR
ncbi:MAG: TadE/TadG family type IV pilus assembly protein [Rhodospirillaceae bacterium]